MSRLYSKYTDSNPPIDCYLSNSKWYRNSGTFTPKGCLLHDTAADNVYIHRYDVPADNDPKRGELLQLLGPNPNNNDWNHGGKNKDAGVNAFVGATADGKTVTSVITSAYNKRPWGCGSQTRNGVTYSLNDTHLQWEICQDNKKSVSYFADVIQESIELAAFYCKRFKIDPHGTFKYKGIIVPTICCHWDAYLLGCGSGHTDIYDWDALYDFYGLDMKEIYGNRYKINPLNNPVFNRIRDDIEKAMSDDPGKDGWQRIDGKWYYYDNGTMLRSSWCKWRGGWYYLGADGAMLTGWQTIDGKIYHLDDNGLMAQGEWWGKYFADMSGACSDRGGSWHDENRGRWFGDSTGYYPSNRTVMIDGESYTFDEKGYVKS